MAVAAATSQTGLPRLMLIAPSSLILFMTGAMLLLLVPGPAVLYITSRSIGLGRAAGLVSAMGIAVGTLFHVAAATLGLSALLVSSAAAFQIVKYAGAAYLMPTRRRWILPASALACAAFLARESWSTYSTQRPRFSSSRFCRSSSNRRGATQRCRSSSWECCSR